MRYDDPSHLITILENGSVILAGFLGEGKDLDDRVRCGGRVLE